MSTLLKVRIEVPLPEVGFANASAFMPMERLTFMLE
jgi:hypothetical protein